MADHKTPTNILKMKNSDAAKYSRSLKEPQPPKDETLQPTENLDDQELDVWQDLVNTLSSLNVDHLVDARTATRYAQLYVQYRKLQQFVNQHGVSYPVRDRNGNVKDIKMFPEVRARDSAHEKLFAIERQFGLTPASRANIELDKIQLSDKTKQKYFA